MENPIDDLFNFLNPFLFEEMLCQIFGNFPFNFIAHIHQVCPSLFSGFLKQREYIVILNNFILDKVDQWLSTCVKNVIKRKKILAQTAELFFGLRHPVNLEKCSSDNDEKKELHHRKSWQQPF